MAGADEGGRGEPAKDQAATVHATEANGSLARHGSADNLNAGRIAQSEWTVSDKRGPLSSADTIEGERGSIPGAAGSDHGDQPIGSQLEPTASGRDQEAAGFEPSVSSVPSSDSVSHSVENTPPLSGVDGVRRASPVPLVIAVLVGAAIGAGTAALVYTQYALPDHTARLDRMSSQIAALDQRLPDQSADLSGTVADLEKRVTLLQRQVGGKAAAPNAPAMSSPAQQSATTDGAALTSKVATLQTSVDALQKAAGNNGDLRQTVGSLQTSLKELQSAQKQLANSVDGTRKEASASQNSLASLRDEQKTLASRITAPATAVVADSLITAIQAGQPFGQQVDALGSLGVSGAAMDVLRAQAKSGVMPIAQLATRFDALADQILAAGDKPAPNAGFLSRLKHGLLNLVSVHRTGSTDAASANVAKGTDTASRVAAIKSDLAHGDAGAAYRDWSALPTEAKAASADWGRDVKSSADVLAAARMLQTDSIGTIAAKRS